MRLAMGAAPKEPGLFAKIAAEAGLSFANPRFEPPCGRVQNATLDVMLPTLAGGDATRAKNHSQLPSSCSNAIHDP